MIGVDSSGRSVVRLILIVAGAAIDLALAFVGWGVIVDRPILHNKNAYLPRTNLCRPP